MRLPKKVIVANRPWKVVTHKKDCSAAFSYRDMTITIGTDRESSREVFANFLHEIAEISCVERGIRSQKCVIQHEANDYVFSASHDMFSIMVLDIADVLVEALKLNE
jgi:hypothetical protein